MDNLQIKPISKEIKLPSNIEAEQTLIGSVLVNNDIIDEIANNIAVGRTQYDAPEIDKIVRINDNVNKGEIYNVKINDFNEYELIGTIKK